MFACHCCCYYYTPPARHVPVENASYTLTLSPAKPKLACDPQSPRERLELYCWESRGQDRYQIETQQTSKFAMTTVPVAKPVLRPWSAVMKTFEAEEYLVF